MCFNKEVSLLVFLMGVLSSIKLFVMSNNSSDREKLIGQGIFVLFISLMQLVEFFVWIGIEKKDRNLIKISTNFIIYALIAQILAMIIGFGVLTDLGTNEERITVFVTSSIFIGLMVYCYMNIKGPLIANVDSSTCRLNWVPTQKIFKKFNWMYTIMFMCYLISVFVSSWIIFGELGPILLGVTLFLSIIYSIYLQKMKSSIIGSLWCFSIVVFFSAIMFF